MASFLNTDFDDMCVAGDMDVDVDVDVDVSVSENTRVKSAIAAGLIVNTILLSIL